MDSSGTFRHGLRLVAAGLLCVVLSAAALAAGKKGVCIADRTAADRVEALHVDWYYTWSPYPEDGRVGAEFVPMISGKHQLEEQIGAMQHRGRVPVLLVINEPNHADQANMSVPDVVRLWPRLAPLADRLSTPVTANPITAWSTAFDEVRKRDGLKADFMPLHIYGPPDAKQFLHKLDAAHATFGLPVWITEFAVVDKDADDRRPGSNHYSEEQVLQFMKEVLPELERRDWVERYAWYGAGKISSAHEKVRTSALFTPDGRLTAVGQFYASFRGGR